MSPQAILSCARAVQPLVFETGNPYTPISTAGTGFLVVTAGRGFLITARHLMGLGDLSPLCIFPTATSRRLIPLRNVFFIPKEQFDDDFSDFAIVEIDVKKLDLETGEGTAINLEIAEADWLAVRDSSSFTVIGYPLEHSEVDYDNELLTNRQFVLHGRYTGSAVFRFLHELQVDDGQGLSDFRGFSGSPVFSWHEYAPDQARITLCGMAVQGGVKSRCVRFIEWQVIAEAIKQKIRIDA